MRTKHSMRHRAAALFLLSAPAATAFGQAFHTVSAMNTGEEWFNTNPIYRNTVWWSATNPTTGELEFASGVAIDPYNVLITGHQAWSSLVGGVTTDHRIGTGTNFFTDPGNVLYASNVVIHPGWDGTLFSQRVDLALLHFEDAIPGIEPLTITSAVLGEELRGGGFGRPGAAGQWLEIDRQGRGFKMWADGYGSGVISSDYLLSRFVGSSFFHNGDPMEGGATNGSSGSGVFNLNGDLVALAVGIGGSGTTPAAPFSTFSLRLDLYQDWINANRFTVPSSIPAPGAAALLALAGIAAARRRR